MSRLSSFGTDATVQEDDRVIGTDSVDNSTKNFTVGSLAAFIQPQIVNQRTGSLTKVFFGTQLQIDAATREADTVYILTA